ncbi:MAG TPA: helix-turn-helix domain-containing protein [Gemmatimonadaceae bacterium]|nr:helix-turn-helix domain-containing protein [Gemmatimonadaceae bacterium]
MAESVSLVCARFHRAIELIGGRWSGAIIRTLLQGKTRYALIKAAIPDITDRMLSERLRSLEAEGLVTRRVIPESPVRVEYELTEKGRSLEPALNEIGSWAERWIPGDPEPAEQSPAAAATPEIRGFQRAPRGPRIRAR